MSRQPAPGPRKALAPGSVAPGFALHDSPHSKVALDDYRGRAVVLVFYVADWHPVASAQLCVFAELATHIDRLGASVLGISVDATWSHDAFARANEVPFPLLADDEPPGAVARSYGVYVPESGRSRRALFVIDGGGVVRWSGTYPDAVNPGIHDVLSSLEALRTGEEAGSGEATGGRVALEEPGMARDGDCPCGCGLSRMATMAGR